MALLPSEVLAKAADLIEPEGRWMQGEWQDGPRQCFCAEGAMAEIAQVSPCLMDEHSASRFLERAAGIPWFGVPTWNDQPGRTQAEVVATLRKASELARSEGQ